MFDILVDQPKKRLYLSLIIVGLILELVLLLDLFFAVDVLKATTFTELLDLQYRNDQSFYSYFFFSALSSGTAYASFSLDTFLDYVVLVLKAFSMWDWLLISALVFLQISHHSRQSKISLCLLGVFFIFRFVVLIGLSAFLISAMNANSAGAVLNRIQTSGILLIFILSFALVGNGYRTFHLIRKDYLPLFKENDSH